MSFIFTALNHEKFEHLHGLSDDELKAKGIVSYVAGTDRMPCRVSLALAEPNERVLLLNHTHLETNSPYRASHAIFVRMGAKEKQHGKNEVPTLLEHSNISARAFDENDMMLYYNFTEGAKTKECLDKLFTNKNVKYIDVHFAGPGCFFSRVIRA